MKATDKGERMGTKEHKKGTLKVLKIAIISVSSTRTIAEDDSGLWMKKMSEKEGHTVVLHRVVPDDKKYITAALFDAINLSDAQAVLLTGGTGISSKDVTIEAISPLFQKELTAFGPVFAQLSLEKIDSAAIHVPCYRRDCQQNSRFLHARQSQRLQTCLQGLDFSRTGAHR